MSTDTIITVKGPVPCAGLGLILPHEHIFTDLRGPSVPGYAQADPDKVARVMGPYLEAASAAGVTALVECSTVGVGRNVAVLSRVAQSTPIHIVAPTGVYREAYVPQALWDLTAAELAEMWVKDLLEGMDGTGIRAGFIKISMSDDGPTEMEVRNLKAAARASLATGAVIASHTANGAIAIRQLEVLQAEGLSLERFIWVHANLETGMDLHLQAARRGAYVEFDAVGWDWQPQPALADYTQALVAAGHVDRILLSHDAGWYDPSQPDGRPAGNQFHGYTPLVEEFIPYLKERGLSEETIHRITVTNPARAFSFK